LGLSAPRDVVTLYVRNLLGVGGPSRGGEGKGTKEEEILKVSDSG